MKNITIPLAMLIILMNSCSKTVTQKPAPNTDVDIYFDKAALEYIQLPVNRHFIYKDSATGNIDSVLATQSDLSNFTTPGNPAFSVPPVYSQKYHLVLTRTNGSGTIWFQGLANSLQGAGFQYAPDTTAVISFNASDNIVTDTLPEYGFLSNGFDISQSLNSLTVESTIYHDVFVYTYSNQSFRMPQTVPIISTYYWARNVGIVKRTIEKDSVITTSLLESYGD